MTDTDSLLVSPQQSNLPDTVGESMSLTQGW